MPALTDRSDGPPMDRILATISDRVAQSLVSHLSNFQEQGSVTDNARMKLQGLLCPAGVPDNSQSQVLDLVNIIPCHHHWILLISLRASSTLESWLLSFTLASVTIRRFCQIVHRQRLLKERSKSKFLHVHNFPRLHQRPPATKLHSLIMDLSRRDAKLSVGSGFCSVPLSAVPTISPPLSQPQRKTKTIMLRDRRLPSRGNCKAMSEICRKGKRHW